MSRLTPRHEYNPRRIAITGGTGALGTHFLSRLLQEAPDVQVAALVRPAAPESRCPAFQRLMRMYAERITLVTQDLSALNPTPTERRLLGESDALWHFGASTNMLSRGGDSNLWQSNDAGTGSLLDVLLSLDRPGPLMHISTAYVCGEKTGTLLEDDLSPRTFRNSYESSKFSAEQRVQSAFASGLGGCILRPSVVVEDEADDGSAKIIDMVATAVLAAAQTGEPLVLRLPRTASINAIHIDWLYAAMTTLAAKVSTGGRTYHLTARNSLRVADIAEFAASEAADWKVIIDPSARPRDLPMASRLLDRSLTAFAPYLMADVQFDRTNFEADAPDLATVPELDPRAVLRLRRRLEREKSRSAVLSNA